MAQPIHFSINVSPTHLVAAVVISQILFREKITEIVGKHFHDMTDILLAAGKNLVLDFPVIALTTGLTYAEQQLTPYAPALSLSSEGAMKAATFVGGVFALKSALAPLLKQVTKPKKEAISHGTMLRNSVVLHLLPVALGTLYAYYDSIPVKLTQSALYISALIPVVKLVGKGIDLFCEMEGVKERIQEWYSWMNLEQSLSKSSQYSSNFF
jgi:hypothetical protein